MNKDNYYWDRHNATTAGQYLDHQERSIVNEFFDRYTPQLCLDIACGSGRFSLPIINKGICIIAGDIDPIATRVLHSKMLELQNKENLSSVLQINAEFLPFQASVFDCILSIQTVGYLDLRRFFSECNKVLRDGGWFLFNEANRYSYKAPIFHRISSSTRFYRHSYYEVYTALEDSGFQIRKAVGMNWLPIKRDSDSRWIPLASKVERKLRLRNFPSVSPWVFYVAQKR